MNILHLNTESGWRGGENQTRIFIKNSLDYNLIKNHVACLEAEKAFSIFNDICPVFPLRSKFQYSPLEAYRIAMYCNKNDIKILDAQTGKTHSLAILIKKFKPDLKIVVHRRVDNPIKSNWITKKKYFSKAIDHYVAISSAIHQIMANYGIPSDNITTIPSAIDSTPFDKFSKLEEKKLWAKKLNIDPNTLWFGNASAIAEQKAYDVLLNAASLLKQKQIPFHCLIAGDGPLLTAMRNLAKSLNLSQDVTFLGFIDSTPSFLKALDILAVPSNNEGLGTIIQEGAYAGCATIATEVGGIPEMILHDQTGILIKRKDHQGLSLGLESLISNEGLRKKLAENLESHIKKNFSVANMITGNLDIYKKVIAI